MRGYENVTARQLVRLFNEVTKPVGAVGIFIVVNQSGSHNKVYIASGSDDPKVWGYFGGLGSTLNPTHKGSGGVPVAREIVAKKVREGYQWITPDESGELLNEIVKALRHNPNPNIQEVCVNSIVSEEITISPKSGNGSDFSILSDVEA